MRLRALWALSSMALCLSPLAALAQSPVSSSCSLTLPSFTSSAPNIFNDQQEQYLGEALAEQEESNLHLIPPGPDDQMTRIGEKLLAALPPSGVHYRFRIYDSGEINGFSLGGGRVYISRKLIAAVKNEDELAGVLAHEIGHIYTHQAAIEFTRALRFRIGTTQVGDRADVFAKIHLFFSTPPKEGEEKDREKVDQLLADRVALYAMTGAGYAPGSFVSFLNESMMNKGKTGNWLSDAFGITSEASQRYRTALKLISVLPSGCKEIQPASSTAFASWQKNVVEERAKAIAEGVNGDRPIKLDPPLRPNLWHIRFSSDGRYVLAQDEGSITIVDKAAVKVLFRIDAPDVEAAQFTPDSQSVVFHNSDLRIEKWNIASGKRTSVKELVVYDGCRQTLLSPNGDILICGNISFHDGNPRIDLRLIDVESGKVFFEKPGFYSGSKFASQGATYLLALESLAGINFIKMIVSPDGRYLIATSFDRSLGYDLEHRQPVALGGKFQELGQARMSFLGPDQVYLIGNEIKNGLNKARILSFPEGRLVQETQIGDQQVESTSKGRTVIIRPLKNYAAGILDPIQGKILVGSKLAALDAWNSSAAMEGSTGGLFLAEVGVPEMQQVILPMGPLPNPRAAAFSSDGKFLAISLRNRADLWDLQTGKQLSLIRPFRSMWIDGEDHLIGQFTKFLDKEPTELKLSLTSSGAHDLGKYESNDWQYRNMQVRFKPQGHDKAIDHHATLEVKSMETQTVAWSRDYPHEMPACWEAEDNRLVLAWDLSNDTAKSEIKSNPALQRESSALKNQKKGLLLETVTLTTGVPLEQVVLPEADLSNGHSDQRRAEVSGEFVLVRGEHGNTVIYSLKDGSKVGEFFGFVIATDAKPGLIVATNREDEIILVDERTGKELQRFSLGSPIRVAQIVPGTLGKDGSILILTADQIVHRLPLPGETASETALSKGSMP
jgi:WD40 repeat protein